MALRESSRGRESHSLKESRRAGGWVGLGGGGERYTGCIPAETSMGRGGGRETGQAVEQARGQVESTDSIHLPGFWDRQTRNFWAIKERWAHLSETRAPAKRFTLHPTQRATDGNSEMPACSGH